MASTGGSAQDWTANDLSHLPSLWFIIYYPRFCFFKRTYSVIDTLVGRPRCAEMALKGYLAFEQIIFCRL